MNVSKKIYDFEKQIKELNYERDSMRSLYESLSLDMLVNERDRWDFIHFLLYLAYMETDRSDDHDSVYSFLVKNM